MDPTMELALEDYNLLKPKKKPKVMTKRKALQFLLPLSISCFVLSHFSPVSYTSLTHFVEHYVNKKNLFLFCNIILVVLAIDYRLCPMFTRKSLAWRPPSESNAIVVVEKTKKEQEVVSVADKIYNDLFIDNVEHDSSLWITTTNAFKSEAEAEAEPEEEVIEEKSIILIESNAKEKDIIAEEEEEEEKKADGFFGDFFLRYEEDKMPWMLKRSLEIEAEIQIKAIEDVVSKFEVEIREGKEIVRVREDRMELTELGELNDKCYEFIERQRRIWQSEGIADGGLQLVVV